MTKISPEIKENMLTASVLPVSADVSFASNCFPKYKLGPNNQILEERKEDSKGLCLKEVVEQETAQLTEQHNQLSVHDLASKFDKNLTTAAKLVELREVASLEGHVLLKKLRDALEALRGCMVGRNKNDVEKAISMVEALAVKLTQKEGELIQEKLSKTVLSYLLKLCDESTQASEDAKKLINQEKSFACAEIESARAVVHRFGEALEEEDRNYSKPKTQDVEFLVEEVQEARRIKQSHQPTKVLDMEHELHALRAQLQEKSLLMVKFQESSFQLATSKRAKDNKSHLYCLDGSETLGSYLQIQPCSDISPQLSKCSIQWYRVSPDGSQREVISGATKSAYAPEPFDVGQVLQADIHLNGQKVSVSSAGPIEPDTGLGSYIESLLWKSSSEFIVVISQMNGQDYSLHSNHVFTLGKMRIKLCRGWITKARENYHTSMQLCGFRGDGNVAAKSLLWQARKGLSFVLTFESERARNTAIMIARKHGLDCNVMVGGPEDRMLTNGGFHKCEYLD